MNRDARARAAEALGIASDATPDDATRAFLSGLSSADFLPTTESVVSLNALAGKSLPNDLDESNSLLRNEVEDFTGCYWSLAPEERSREWASLRDRAPEGAICKRIDWLEIGLPLPGEPLPEQSQERIAAIARELYLLTERKRAIRRNEWLLANASKFGERIAAAKSLCERHPQFALLEPVLFSRLMPEFKVAMFAAVAGAEPLAEHPDEQSDSIVYKPTELALPVQAEKTVTQPSGFWKLLRGPGSYLIGPGIVVAIKLCIAFFSGTSGSNPAPVPSLPLHEWSPTPAEIESLQKLSRQSSTRAKSFTREQVQQCEEYEKNPNTKKLPPQYLDWSLAGRPPPNDHVPSLNPKESESKASQKVRVPYSTEDIPYFRAYEKSPIGNPPRGYESWVQSGRPSKAP